MMDDDEDSFLYGDSTPTPAPVVQSAGVTPEPVTLAQKSHDAVEVISVPGEAVEKQTNGFVEHLEDEVEAEDRVAVAFEGEAQKEEQANANGDVVEERDNTEQVEEEGDEDEEAEEEDSDDDVEFILEPPKRSLDFRSQQHRPGQVRATSASAPSAPAINLTTEYTPRERGAPPDPTKPPPILGQTETSQLAPATPAINASGRPPTQPATTGQQASTDQGPDPSTLPPVRAPPSHPHIDPEVPGTYEGRSIFEVDMTNLAEKPWRRPGSDISDWFNYGFDEISWEAYCYRRRALGEMAGVLKTNVLNFAGMAEEQFLALPPEARTMVLTGTNALMNSGGGPSGPPGVGVGPGMMPGVGMNPMGGMNPMMAAEMGGMAGMGPMGVPGMGMGMNGDMGVGMPGQGQGPMMQDGQVLGQGPNAAGPSGTPEQVGQMALPDGMPGGAPGMMGMGMNMGPDFNPMQMQDGPVQNQQLHPNMDVSTTTPRETSTPVSGAVPISVPPRVGSTPASFRGRGGVGTANIPVAPRAGRSVPTFPARGRGAPTLPNRPASPLPPNVPTGPRNPVNRYKDRDNNAPAVEGLDYGGGNKDGGGGATPTERERERDRERDRDRDRERERERDRVRDRERENRDREVEEKSVRKRRSPPGNDEDRIGRSLRSRR